MKASEAAYRAADLISERGLAKGVLEDREGRLCFDGALFLAAAGSRGTLVPMRPAVVARIGESAGILLAVEAASRAIRGSRDPSSAYNDRLPTSAEDVILLLKGCGRRLEDGDLQVPAAMTAPARPLSSRTSWHLKRQRTSARKTRTRKNPSPDPAATLQQPTGKEPGS